MLQIIHMYTRPIANKEKESLEIHCFSWHPDMHHQQFDLLASKLSRQESSIIS